MISVDKVLIVDDDSTAHFLMTRIIKSTIANRQILYANNGQEALTILHEHCFIERCPTLILLDINMPVMDGFEFLNAIQDTPLAKLPLHIVVLTSSVNPVDVRKALRFPIVGYMEKPLTVEKLILAIE
ncbi:response regulator (plasmid) [Adhaeribacter swui]|uniref:Response regulator n=1 Tax=Adhaeribacter swui TaxID=2086471 RepID=A0A7G7G2I9_9BACT|nr:response regulator [Adhaeribacter swui]QNF31373.1 response regulator [Adhaeribacter swui]